MWLLDVLAKWGPYLPTLIFFWFMAAYVVAGIRGRRYLNTRQRISYFGGSISLVLVPVMIYLWSPWRNVESRLLWWVLYNAVFIVWPLILNQTLVRDRKRWRAFGYARTTDVLLFRHPAETPLPEELTDIERRSNRALYWSVLGVSLGLIALGFLCMGLSTCEWLDIAAGRSGCFRVLTFDEGSSFGEIAFSPDGQYMVVGTWKGPLRLYDVAHDKVLRELPDQKTDCGRSVSFSPDNRWVATVSETNLISISDVQTGLPIQNLKAITNTHSLQFSPDGRYLAVSLGHAGLQLWQTDNWKLHWVISAPFFSVSFSADGRWLAGETTGERIGIWNMNDGTVYQTIYDRAYSLALSPDGKELAVASAIMPTRIWDVSTGALVRSVAADTLWNYAYSPDGQYLLAGESFIRQFLSYTYQVGLWRTTDGQRIATLPAYNNIGCAAFAAKNNVFAYSDWKSLKIFRLRQD